MCLTKIIECDCHDINLFYSNEVLKFEIIFLQIWNQKVK